MKKKLYFLTFLLCLLCGFNTSQIMAQTTVIIGNGTSENYCLADNYSGHGASQQIYTSEEIAAAGGYTGTITSIAFNKADGADYNRTWMYI